MKGTLHCFPAPAAQPEMSEEQARRFADTVFELADRANAAEAELWARVAELAGAGDCPTVKRIAEMRRTMGPTDILSALRRAAP